jgi:hypothetical protein
MKRIVVYEVSHADGGGLARALRVGPWEVVACGDGQGLIEELLRRPAGAVIYALSKDGARDVGVLQLLRRVALEVPLVLIAADTSLPLRQTLQEFNPIYCAVRPVDWAELCDAVSAALGSRR